MSPRRITLKVNSNASHDERIIIGECLVGIGKSVSYATAIATTRSGLFYALTPEELPAFKLITRLRGIDHLIWTSE